MITQTRAEKRRAKLEHQLAAVQIPVNQTGWDKAKAFFHYSMTILLARATTLIGFAIAAVGSLNYAPFLSLNIDTGFSRNQVVWLGTVVVIQGVLTELARRRSLVDD